MPAARADSNIGPDSRVSRTITTCGRSTRVSAAAARPRATASSGVRSSPTGPRTPSVPNSLRFAVREAGSIGGAPNAGPSAGAATSALRELRTLAGLLETRLAPLLAARVARQQPSALELPSQLRIDLAQGPRDAVTHRPGLAGDAPAVYADAHVHVALVSGGDQGLSRHRLVEGARKVLVELAPVDLEAAAPGQHDHTGDRALALPGGLDPYVALERDRRFAGRRRLLAGLLGGRRLAPRPLLGFGLAAGALLGGELSLLLDRDRLELGSGDSVLLLLALGRRSLLLLGRGLGLGCLFLGGLRRLLGGSLFLLLVLSLFLGHQSSISSVRGCCAAWGWSGPAYTFSFVSCLRPSRLRGSIPRTASRITSSGRRSSISPSVRERIPPG